MKVPVGSVAARRARLAIRHRLAPSARADGVADVARSLVGLHSSDPVTVYLSAAARLRLPTIELIDRALYRDREVVRQHAMRRTLWVLTPELARAARASSTALIAPMRRTMCTLLVANGVTDDPDRWLDHAIGSIADLLADVGEASARQVGEALPDLSVRLRVPPGDPSGAMIAAHTRVLNLMGFLGIAVRARPVGTWISSQYRWTLADRWLSRGLGGGDLPTAAATIVDRYLRAFGPASMIDIQWWTGWTKLTTTTAIMDCGAETVDGTHGELWVAGGDTRADLDPGPWVALLPGLDPSVMGWKQRDWYIHDSYIPALFDRNGNAGPTIWADGRVVGGWAQRPDGRLAHRLLETISTNHEHLLRLEVERVESFVGDARFTIRFPTPLSRELSS